MDFNEAKTEIKRRIDIVDFFNQRGYDLKQSGSRYVTLCPFHSEKTPSFSINEATESWYCFGCRKHGDIFTYLMEKDGLTFPEAVQEMADQLGITIARDDKAASRIRKRTSLMEIVDATWKWFKSNYDALPEDHIVKAHEIREKRGISSDNADNHDLFGWAPEDRHALEKHLSTLGYKVQDMVDAGVINRSKDGRSTYCMWSARLMFPICDIQGRPMGFSGRQVYEDPDTKIKRKYVNSHDSDLYHKRDLLFCQSIALDQARRDHELYVVEGQFDVIAMQHSGHENTVASSGTAITEQQAQSMRRMVGPDGRIIFMFDSDDAGQKAAERTFRTIGPVQGQAYASITKGKDPSDMLHDEGAEALRRQVEDHVEELWLHVLKNMVQSSDIGTSSGRRTFVNKLKPTWASVRDAEVADSMIREASLLSGIPMTPLSSQLGDRQVNDDEDLPLVLEDIAIPDSVKDSDPVARNLLATAYENPEARFILRKVRMDGIDEEFRQWLVSKGTGKAVPEETNDDRLVKYAVLLNETMDRMHTIEQAAPVMTDLSSLLQQQVEVFLIHRREQKKRDVIADISKAGLSTDRTILEEYDSKVTNSMEDIDDRFRKNLAKANESIIEKLGRPEDHRPIPTLYHHGEDVKPAPSLILKAHEESVKRQQEMETVDVNEPVLSEANGSVGNDDQPYFDPDEYPEPEEDYGDIIYTE